MRFISKLILSKSVRGTTLLFTDKESELYYENTFILALGALLPQLEAFVTVPIYSNLIKT